MNEIVTTEMEIPNTIAATIFALPEHIPELSGCLIDFVLVFLLILLLKSSWIDYMAMKGKVVNKKQKVLFWEISTFIALFVFYGIGQYCVVLPLLFMLTIFVLWYLVQVYAR